MRFCIFLKIPNQTEDSRGVLETKRSLFEKKKFFSMRKLRSNTWMWKQSKISDQFRANYFLGFLILFRDRDRYKVAQDFIKEARPLRNANPNGASVLGVIQLLKEERRSQIELASRLMLDVYYKRVFIQTLPYSSTGYNIACVEYKN